MSSRPGVFAVMILVLVHQLVAGVFAGGTILCLGGAGGIALQPVGVTCCATDAVPTTADHCCADDVIDHCNVAAAPGGCEGCSDHDLTAATTLAALFWDMALPTTAPRVIAVITWPAIAAPVRNLGAQRSADRAPPPLAFLSTVILRC